MKKCLTMILAVMMLLSVPIMAYAKEGDFVETNRKDAVIVRENLTGSGIIPRNKYLSDYYASLTDRGNGIVRAYANSECYDGTEPFRVKVYIYLQQYINGEWKTIDVFNEYREYDDYVSVCYDRSVTKNYYYRVKSVHVATDRVIREEATLHTGALWVE